MMELSEPPKNRYEFERRCHLLAEALNNQKIYFSTETPRTVESIKKVRFSPNRRIDLLTIDESLRALFVMLNNMSDQKEEQE